MISTSVKNISELPEIAKQILSFARMNNENGQFQDKKIFCFYGELGAGKTTLIKELCKQLGVTDAGSSPTFALVNEYRTTVPFLKAEKNQNSPLWVEGIIFHLDLYRLQSEAEIYDIGYEDYIFSGNYCFIEWPEKMEHLLPSDAVRIKIEVKNSARVISIL
ncbi:MAG: tRNA (adenosine(37)-N6)-threonylcarbamoyltransferase complex ATPase subunit type 1 TsaE [Bacteroidota bacterium]